MTVPAAATVTISEAAVTQAPPSGFSFVGQQVDISISPPPPADPNNPITIVFRLDFSLGVGQNVAIFKNGAGPVAACNAPGVANPDPCVSNRTTLGDGDVQITVLTTSASSWNFGLSTGVHDGRAKKISAASKVVLPDVKNVTIQVRNEGDHTDSFAVYVDIIPPGGITNPYGCTPIGRIINQVVTLAPGGQTTVHATPAFNCANVAGAAGATYTIEAAVDAHDDDEGACAPFQIQSMACFNALAHDDDDDGDNRVTKNAFKVK